MLIRKNENVDNFTGAVSLSSVFRVLKDWACKSSTFSLSRGLWVFWSCLFWNKKAWMKGRPNGTKRSWKCNIWCFSFSGGERHLGRVWDYDFAWMCYYFFTTMGFSKEYHTFIFDILHRSVSVNEGAPYSKRV